MLAHGMLLNRELVNGGPFMLERFVVALCLQLALCTDQMFVLPSFSRERDLGFPSSLSAKCCSWNVLLDMVVCLNIA